LGAEHGLGRLLIVVDWVTEVGSVMEGVDGLFEGEALIIPVTWSLGLDTIVAGWLAFVTLDTSFPASLRNVVSHLGGCGNVRGFIYDTTY